MKAKLFTLTHVTQEQFDSLIPPENHHIPQHDHKRIMEAMRASTKKIRDLMDHSLPVQARIVNYLHRSLLTILLQREDTGGSDMADLAEEAFMQGFVMGNEFGNRFPHPPTEFEMVPDDEKHKPEPTEIDEMMPMRSRAERAPRHGGKG